MKVAQAQLPDRLPPTYVKKVADSFSPTRDQLAAMSRDELLQAVAKREELEELISEDPVRFFHPNPDGGQRGFMTCGDGDIQGCYYFAANKTGKTTAGAIYCGEFGEGKPLWEANKRRLDLNAWFSPRPKRICFFTEDFSTHEETIVPTYISWMKRYVDDIQKGPSGNLARIIHKNGTNIYLRTYDQGYAKAEGKDYDLVWCDEPPPRDLYTAIFRGLVATRGRLLITATLLSELWLYEESQHPFIKVFESVMTDNRWLDAKTRENFAMMLSEDERQIRIFGRPASLSGRIYQMFVDGPPFVIPQLEPPWDVFHDRPWPVVLGIDPHERKPVYALWGYLTPNGGVAWFDWDLIPSDSTYAVFQRIEEREKTHKAKTTVVVIDPNRGVQRQKDGRSWKDEFEDREYPVVVANDSINDGHRVMKEFLSSIRMVWMESCRGKGGPIYQTAHYSWEDWARGSRFEKSPKVKPKDVSKDFPDIERYVAVAIDDGLIDFDTLMGDDADSVSLLGENRGRNSYL